MSKVYKIINRVTGETALRTTNNQVALSFWIKQPKPNKWRLLIEEPTTEPKDAAQLIDEDIDNYVAALELQAKEHDLIAMEQHYLAGGYDEPDYE